jgi:hypothetical protein
MATLTLRPTSDYSVQLTRSTGSYNYTCVDEATLDTADYVSTPNATGDLADSYGLPDHSSETGTINSVKICVNARVAAMNVSSTEFYIGCNGGNWHLEVSTTTSPAFWLDFNNSWSTNPSTSSAWTWSDIDSLRASIRFVTVKGGGKFASVVGDCSQIYVEVDYTEVTGWANIKNIRAGTGSITATDLSHVWFGTSSVAVADIAEIPTGVAV